MHEESKISVFDSNSRQGCIKYTFYDDFKHLINDTIPSDRLSFNYNAPEFDIGNKYPIDCCINGLEKPIFLFAIPNDSKCKDVMISLYQFEKWGIPFHSVSIFQDQESINRRVLARFSDIGEKQFSSLISNKDRIKNYLNLQIS